jgi:hypothetical protein
VKSASVRRGSGRSAATRRALDALVLLGAIVLVSPSLRADEKTTTEGPKAQLVDRVVVRWSSTERGLVNKPQVIFARELAFEARLEAMAGGEAPEAPLTERYIRAALNRHIAEGLLAMLPIDPAPKPEDIATRATAASDVLEGRVGGAAKIAKALEIEGLSEEELAAILRRSARASIYLDRMVAPQIEPTRQELLELQASGSTPYTKEPFDKVEDKLKRWLVAQRLNDALDTFFQKSRSKVVVTWAKPPA